MPKLEKMSKSRGNVISVDDILGCRVCPACGYGGQNGSDWTAASECPRCLKDGEHVCCVLVSGEAYKRISTEYEKSHPTVVRPWR